MQTNFIIKDKKLNTSILIKKNYISTFVKKLQKKMKGYFVLLIQKLKINSILKKKKM